MLCVTNNALSNALYDDIKKMGLMAKSQHLDLKMD